MKLRPHYVEKPWGRLRLPPAFPDAQGKRIGEIWFVGDPSLPMLAKYLFTSEPLSVQVHPDDEQARTRGFAHGKSECWYILDAEPDATIGLGLRSTVTAEELCAAALDGSILGLIDWRPVAAGDFLYVPAGTVHAIGSGLSLLEFQQNCDVTYRLYDYGRPRELHLEEAVSVANRSPYPGELAGKVGDTEESVLVDGPKFTLVHSRADAHRDRRRWILPLEGRVRIGDDAGGAGECLVAEPGQEVHVDGARMLIGAEA